MESLDDSAATPLLSTDQCTYVTLIHIIVSGIIKNFNANISVFVVIYLVVNEVRGMLTRSAVPWGQWPLL